VSQQTIQSGGWQFEKRKAACIYDVFPIQILESGKLDEINLHGGGCNKLCNLRQSPHDFNTTYSFDYLKLLNASKMLF